MSVRLLRAFVLAATLGPMATACGTVETPSRAYYDRQDGQSGRVGPAGQWWGNDQSRPGSPGYLPPP